MTEHPCPVDREIIPAVEVVLDRPRWLIEDFDALEAFEDHTGINGAQMDQMFEVVDQGGGKVSIRMKMTGKQLARWYWAHLRRDDPGITIDHVKHLLSQPRMVARLETARMRLQVEQSRMLAAELADLGLDGDGDEGEGDGDPFDGRGGDSTPSPESTSD